MDASRLSSHLLSLMQCPAFSVQNGIIEYANPAATQLQVQVGDSIEDLLHTGEEAYRAFQGGCLFLTVCIATVIRGASVTRIEGLDIFQIEQDSDNQHLKAYALAAQNLRNPLSNLIAVSQQLFSPEELQTDSDKQHKSAQLNRGLSQMQRLVGNMSDAMLYSTAKMPMETIDVSALFRETMEKCATLLEKAGIALEYSEPNEEIRCLANANRLERAVYNMVSNGAKFSDGGTLQAKLTKNKGFLAFTLQGIGSAGTTAMPADAFYRFLREPGLSDSQQGIGLGMYLIRSAAISHGGTLLLEQPENQGMRMTITIPIRRKSGTLHAQVLRVDAWGGRDGGLIELSDILPSEAFE